MPRRELVQADRFKGEALGRVVSRLRTERGLTAEDLAHKAKARIDTVRSLERGRSASPNVFLVADVVDALDGDLGDVVRKAKRQAQDTHTRRKKPRG